MPLCVRARATRCSSNAARPSSSPTTYFPSLAFPDLTLLRTHARTPRDGRCSSSATRPSSSPRSPSRSTASSSAAWPGPPHPAWPQPRMPTAPHGHSRPAPPRTASPEHRGLTLPHSAAHVACPPPPHAQSRLVPPTPRVPRTGGPDLSLTSAWWVELCCCPGASRPPWLPLSTQAPDQLGVP